VSVFYLNSKDEIEEYNTIAGESVNFYLPDSSQVWLNAKSKISHIKNWEDEREINLKGEAYFEVAKGKLFTVKTSQGTVAVLGTKFNVKQRANYFKVHCYEGSVSVIYKNHKVLLTANETFNSKFINKYQEIGGETPNWIKSKSLFRNSFLKEVLTDIEVQYDIEFILDRKIDQNNLKYTGGYDYSDSLETVLVLICESLNLDYKIKENRIYLSAKK